MRFAFTDDQLAFRDAVRDLLARECPPDVVRSAWSGAGGRSGGAWKALGEMGALGVMVAEEHGGLGLTELDAVLLAEETGRAALPDPFVEHTLVGAPVVSTEAVASGAVTVTCGDGAALDHLVPWADTAGVLVVAGTVLDASVAAIEARSSVDRARRTFTVAPPDSTGAEDAAGTGAGVRVGAGGEQPVGGVGPVGGAGPVRRLSPTERAVALDRLALGYAAQLLGLAHRMLDMTVAYVSERRQFGVPIGSFQAVKHHLADCRLALEFAAPLVYRAAHSMGTGDPEAPVHVSMAKAQASDAAGLTARHALQCHGAIGYSDEHDLHMWMKRAWALAAAGGDAAWHRERVARAIL